MVVAIFADMTCTSEVAQALYGQIVQGVTLWRGPTPAVKPWVERIPDGVWRNQRNGKLETRHDHLAAVWFFQSMRDDQKPPCLFPNPFREDVASILPAPILHDRVFTKDRLPTTD